MKFRNRKVIIDGHRFDSILESEVYKLLKVNPGIKILELQPKVYLTNSNILMKPDFKCQNLDSSLTYYVEAKGLETSVWRIKRRLWLDYGPALLSVYVRKGSRIVLKEVLTPGQKSVKNKS